MKKIIYYLELFAVVVSLLLTVWAILLIGSLILSLGTDDGNLGFIIEISMGFFREYPLGVLIYFFWMIPGWIILKKEKIFI